MLYSNLSSAKTSSKSSIYYSSSKNVYITLCLLFIYYSIFTIILNDYDRLMLILPCLVFLLAIRLAWDSSMQLVSSASAFLAIFITLTIYLNALRTKSRHDLQLLYNLYQMKLITNAPDLSNIRSFESKNASNFNFFFVESNQKRALMSSKQLCSIESAAKNNPQALVYLLTVRASVEPTVESILLNSYPNLRVQKFVAFDLFNRTPLQDWWSRGDVFKSEYYVSHVTDAARFALLYKYGGVYSDLDTLTLKNFRPLIEQQQSGAGYLYERGDSLGVGVLNFRAAHPFLDYLLHKFVNEYDYKVWGSAGPLMLIATLKEYCASENIYMTLKQNRSDAKCDDLTIYPENYFYPYNYRANMNELFASNAKLDIRKLSDTYSLHLYGKFSDTFKIRPGDASIYDFLAQMHCPLVHNYLKANNRLFE